MSPYGHKYKTKDYEEVFYNYCRTWHFDILFKG